MNNFPGAALLLAAALAATPAAAQVGTLYSCPLDGSGGDQVTRGFYVTNYPGSTLEDVTVSYLQGSGDGTYTVSMTPRLSTYAGTIVGATQTQAVNIVGSAGVPVTFNFGGAPVPSGSTVTFTQVLVSGPGTTPVLFYDVGVGPCPNVTETNGTTPPLDSFRRDSIGVTITGSTAFVVPTTAPIPTLGEFALALSSALLALAGMAALRRRERRP